MPFALLGTYEYGNRNNMELIATSKDYEELAKLRNAIQKLNRKLEGKDREISSRKIRRLIDNKLASIDIMDEVTGFVHEIHIAGIFWMEECITVNCGTCHKRLFAGPESEARHLIIYCTECASSTQ
jgi:hypothetical protein